MSEVLPVCEMRFKQLGQTTEKTLELMEDMHEKMFVGNGQEAFAVVQAKQQIEIDHLKSHAHEPRSRTKTVLFDLGKVGAGGGTVVVILKLLEAIMK